MIDSLEEARLTSDAESLEKVQRIMEYLKVLDTHPAMKHRIALHGGTALNQSAEVSSDEAGWHSRDRICRGDFRMMRATCPRS